MTSKKALVLDGRTLSSLAVARSLGQKDYSVHCGESFKWNITRFSKHVDKTIAYPSAEDEPERFVSTLLNVVRQFDYEVIIPTRDVTTELLSRHQKQFKKYTNIYLAEEDVIGTFMDKGKTIKLAQEADVPTPPTYFPEETNLETIKNEIKYPALVRARRSSGSRGIIRVESDEELVEAYETVKGEYEIPMVQEYIEKTGYTTACILLDKEQDLMASFSYERVKEYPLSGGPTVVGVSTNDMEAKEYAKNLLQEGSWKGVAEVEFILDENGDPKLLEVNPRFWMPVQLAISCGIDFPYFVTKLAKGKNLECQLNYEEDITYRWILPNEILWIFESRQIIDGIYDIISDIGDNTCYGIIHKSDIKPVIGMAAQSLSHLIDSEKRKKIFDRGW